MGKEELAMKTLEKIPTTASGGNAELVGSFSKNTRDQVRAILSDYKGHNLIELRVWCPGDDGELHRSMQGFSVQVSLIPALLRLIEQARELAVKRGSLGGF